MNRKESFMAIALILIMWPLDIQGQSSDRSPKEVEYKKLKPEEFAGLPAVIVSELQTIGCSIPQADVDYPHNVIHGEFARPGQTDWAVLCSRNQISSIFVFWGGSLEKPSEIAEFPEEVFDLGGVSWARSISIADKEFILDHNRTADSPELPPIDHVGIDDGFAEKASVVHYYFDGEWLRLWGAD